MIITYWYSLVSISLFLLLEFLLVFIIQEWGEVVNIFIFVLKIYFYI